MCGTGIVYGSRLLFGQHKEGPFFSEELKDEWSVQIIVSFWAGGHWRIPDDKAFMLFYGRLATQSRLGLLFQEVVYTIIYS